MRSRFEAMYGGAFLEITFSLTVNTNTLVDCQVRYDPSDRNVDLGIEGHFHTVELQYHKIVIRDQNGKIRHIFKFNRSQKLIAHSVG